MPRSDDHYGATGGRPTGSTFRSAHVGSTPRVGCPSSASSVLPRSVRTGEKCTARGHRRKACDLLVGENGDERGNHVPRHRKEQPVWEPPGQDIGLVALTREERTHGGIAAYRRISSSRACAMVACA